MTDAPTDRETVERLEQVPHWDGDPCACAWCGESEAAVCIASEPVCATCHTIAYERALIRDRRALRLRAEVAITLRDDAVRERNEMRARAEAAEAEVERLREALTPSAATKSAYMGEVECDCPTETWRHFVPWTAIKAIMAMIRARAALKDGGD